MFMKPTEEKKPTTATTTRKQMTQNKLELVIGSSRFSFETKKKKKFTILLWVVSGIVEADQPNNPLFRFPSFAYIVGDII